jgi:hypothetical protein
MIVALLCDFQILSFVFPGLRLSCLSFSKPGNSAITGFGRVVYTPSKDLPNTNDVAAIGNTITADLPPSLRPTVLLLLS